jgi:hypothetical protein
MPTDSFAGAWIAAHSLHYRGEWSVYALTNPQVALANVRPMQTEDAIATLKHFSGREAGLLRQMAIAELARGNEAFGTGTDELIFDLSATQPIHPDLSTIRNLLAIPDRNERFVNALALGAPGNGGIAAISVVLTTVQC